jgi:hypothetical protein
LIDNDILGRESPENKKLLACLSPIDKNPSIVDFVKNPKSYSRNKCIKNSMLPMDKLNNIARYGKIPKHTLIAGDRS